ncbi:MAG: hypothetical protein ACRC8B_21515, partial [Aeromonas sobria]|uniref:hypothetical protein n=1 Tax=Aeromonas sobria TaxID=646 RepID=UPI003F2DA56E
LGFVITGALCMWHRLIVECPGNIELSKIVKAVDQLYFGGELNYAVYKDVYEHNATTITYYLSPLLDELARELAAEPCDPPLITSESKIQLIFGVDLAEAHLG